jgi:ParB-like chromosome segregation protein Spo0J
MHLLQEEVTKMTQGIMPPPPPPPLAPPSVSPPLEIKTTRYSNKIDPLTKQEYDLLKQSIAQEGLYETIKINQSGDVLDGHHRLKICQELGIEPRFEVKQFDDELQEELYVIDINLARRQLNDYRRGELILSKRSHYLRE